MFVSGDTGQPKEQTLDDLFAVDAMQHGASDPYIFKEGIAPARSDSLPARRNVEYGALAVRLPSILRSQRWVQANGRAHRYVNLVGQDLRERSVLIGDDLIDDGVDLGPAEKVLREDVEANADPGFERRDAVGPVADETAGEVGVRGESRWLSPVIGLEQMAWKRR